MGSSVYPRLVIGATLSPNELMTEIPGTVVCPNGHLPQGGPFCSKCGERLTHQMVRSFIPAFVKFASKVHNQTSDELFEEWSDRANSSQLQFHLVDPVSSSEDWGTRAKKNPNYVLGYRLLEYECTDCRDTNPYSVDLDRIDAIKRQLFEILCALDFTTRDIKLYLCTHVSC